MKLWFRNPGRRSVWHEATPKSANTNYPVALCGRARTEHVKTKTAESENCPIRDWECGACWTARKQAQERTKEAEHYFQNAAVGTLFEEVAETP